MSSCWLYEKFRGWIVGMWEIGIDDWLWWYVGGVGGTWRSGGKSVLSVILEIGEEITVLLCLGLRIDRERSW